MKFSKGLTNIIGDCTAIELPFRDMENVLIQYCNGNFISIATIGEHESDVILLHKDQIANVVEVLTKFLKVKN